MISLNLLSPAQKEALYTRILYAMIERMMIFLACVTLLLTSVMLGVKIRLTQNLAVIESRKVLSSEYVSVNGEITQFNRVIGQVERLQQTAVPVTGFLADLTGRTPPGVLVLSIDFDKQSRSVRFSGRAMTRDRLLEFTEALRGSPYLASVESPISNLFNKVDVDFRLDGIVKPERLAADLPTVADEPKKP